MCICEINEKLIKIYLRNNIILLARNGYEKKIVMMYDMYVRKSQEQTCEQNKFINCDLCILRKQNFYKIFSYQSIDIRYLILNYSLEYT